MPKFLFIYHGGKAPESDAEIQVEIAKWIKWIGDHEGSFVDPGNPVGKSATVSAAGVINNGGPDPAAGYSIVQAVDLATAIAIAKVSPALADDGRIEIAQIDEIG